MLLGVKTLLAVKAMAGVLFQDVEAVWCESCCKACQSLMQKPGEKADNLVNGVNVSGLQPQL